MVPDRPTITERRGAIEAAVRLTNRRILVAVAVMALALALAAGAALGASLRLVADARDAATATKALVALAQREDARRASDEAEARRAADASVAERTAALEAVVARVNEALAKGLALHDANVHADLDALRRLVAARSAPLPPRTPITAAPQSAPNPPPVTTTAPTTTTTPVTVTTTRPCPRLPNGRCRP